MWLWVGVQGFCTHRKRRVHLGKLEASRGPFQEEGFFLAVSQVAHFLSPIYSRCVRVCARARVCFDITEHCRLLPLSPS